jgi:hypothetical protein
MSILYPEVTMSGVIGGALFTTGQSTSPQTDPHDFDVLTPTALAGRRVLMFISHTGYVFYDVNAIIDAGWDHVGGIITEGLPGEHTSFSCSTEVYTRIATGGSQTIPVDVTYLGDVADGHGIYYQVVMLGGIETGLGSIGVTQGVEPQHGGDLDILASIAGPPYGLCVALMATTTPNWYPEQRHAEYTPKAVEQLPGSAGTVRNYGGAGPVYTEPGGRLWQHPCTRCPPKPGHADGLAVQ